MKNTIFVLIFLFTFCNIAISQETQRTVTDPIETALYQQLAAYPQEKIYLQTDKSSYLSGERIWFRSHLIDAQSNKSIFLSRYVYVELINPLEEVVDRVKIRPDSIGVYSGFVDLENDLPEGSYTLRAYTRYMRNDGNEVFFKKPILVLDPFSLQLEPIATFNVNKNNVEVSFMFIDRQLNDTIKPEVVSCKLNDESAKTLSAKNSNSFNWKFSYPAIATNRTFLLSLAYNKRKYNRYYTIPYPSDEFDVAFFPEGGYIIPGSTSQVAFKALNPSGLGENISITLYNSKDEAILNAQSIRIGMGFFNFVPQPDETYYAVCQNESGISKRFDLPLPNKSATILSARLIGSRLMVSVRKGETAPSEQLSLLIHNKGQMLYHDLWDPQTETFTIASKLLPSGIISILLLNEKKDILSERLIFSLKDEDLANTQSELSAPSYKQREHITLKVNLSEADSITIFDNFAVSVIDKKTVEQDTTNTILSTLLLTSELNGFIESPGAYFSGTSIDKFGLDALMMTQGWKRYDVPKVIKGEISEPKLFLPEQYQEITGKSDGLFRSLKEGQISLMASLDSLVSSETTQADDKGRFEFKVEYPEGTTITIQSLSKKGGKHNLINIDPITFPDNKFAAIPIKPFIANKTDFDLDSYLKQADQDYTQKNGIRTILLEEFTVTAQSKEKYKESKYYSPIYATGLLTAQDLEKRKTSSLRSLLITMPGIIMKTDKVTTTRSEQPALFVINDMEYEDFFDRLDDIDVNSIDNIFVVRDNTALLGYHPNTSGAVIINLKEGFDQTKIKSKSLNIDRIVPLGFQKAEAFYSPKYETPEQKDSEIPDLRTTIYWKPNVQFNSEKEAVIDFYSADSSGSYLVTGEGVTVSGKIIRFTKEIPIEK